MDKYEVIGLLGEGSFGRVYKAKQISDAATVALKVISKRGRSVKEIKGLRRECEIQRHLHHPNIIQMIDSFETENEIVVITEFAHKELTVILSKEGYLPEDRVQAIVWDLVSALYYLHSHRVLHRDLKPQNILLDTKSNAKLCDFGFARNMSTGTHVLTSIKGTPLYMAPELIEEHPYDHNADLWSLGCIVYELLVGAPPFCTTSILHLIRMIRHEQIQFPTFISDGCISFLKGLLQKDPTKRVAWPEILRHPFVKGHILILDDVPSKPLTRPLSIDTLQAKEQQRKDCLIQKANAKLPSSKSTELVTDQTKSNSKNKKPCATSNPHFEQDETKSSVHKDENIEEKFTLLSLEPNASTKGQESHEFSKDDKTDIIFSDTEDKRPLNNNVSGEPTENTCKSSIKIEENLSFCENSNPLENEEWVVFLQRTIEEIMAGEMTSISQPSLANIIVSPLQNSNASSKVLGLVAGLLSLPFVVPGTSDDMLEQIRKVYFDLKLVPNLVYASKLLLKHKSTSDSNNLNASSSLNSLSQDMEQGCRSVTELTEEDLHALEYLYLLICHLVHLDAQFLIQFCDSVAVLNMYKILQNLLLLSKRKLRVVIDLIAILTHVLRKLPENSELVSRTILITEYATGIENEETINFVQLLRHSSALLRERSCNFLQFLGKTSSETLEILWSEVMRDTLEVLMYDSIEDVRNAAEVTVEELKRLAFYDKNCSSE